MTATPMVRLITLFCLAALSPLVAADARCDAPALDPPVADYKAKVTALHEQLGIPEDYSERTGLSLQPTNERLVVAGVDRRMGVFLMSAEAAKAWLEMQAAARVEGVELFPVSTYRGVFEQAEIVRQRLNDNQTIEEVLKTSAAPGYSEHHTGDAIDLATPNGPGLTQEFATTEAYAWLTANAGDYCFTLSYPEDNDHGLAFEPWHWRFERSM
ncbi:M15 family metallopeptidase [Aquisalimonas sp.]|uniref:M15 family metallopeptidase n=1 Tax=Aquisalimonas sp. TaxID=1872621 RepID=UPI0025C22D7F|nr:M15 family metallopeptidase [Aquisalimonas sp.]